MFTLLLFRKAAIGIAGAALCLLACGGGEPEGGSSGGSGTACERDTRKDIYAAGLAKQNAALSVKIVSSTPSPPVKGTNAMTLEIADSAGKPIDGATVSMTPYMIDHAHGSAVTPAVAPLGGGRYDVTKIYFPMPGLWKLTVTVQTAGAAPQEVAFAFCFEG